MQDPFMENSQKNRNRGGLLQLDKGLLQKPRANTVLNGKRLNAFIQRLGKKQGFLLLSPLINIEYRKL